MNQLPEAHFPLEENQQLHDNQENQNQTDHQLCQPNNPYCFENTHLQYI